MGKLFDKDNMFENVQKIAFNCRIVLLNEDIQL